jgi:peptidoglycan hydrolase-like protein with peptidoglycan-binding domain
MYWPLQAQGATGENVRTIQYLINARGAALTVDGIYGPLTAAAVQAFQSTVGLAADGIVGDATWGALLMQLEPGNTGPAVSAAQSQLNIRSSLVTVSGTFDAATRSAVQQFQTPIGLNADGVVDWYTWHAIVTGFLTATEASNCMKDVFEAWSTNDQLAASHNATPSSLSTLFGRPWSTADGWTFDSCGGAAGHIYCTWNRPGGSLLIGGPDPGGGLYIYVDSVKFS